MDAMENQFVVIREFNKLSEIHNAYPVAYMLDNAEIVGYEKVCEPHLGLKPFEHVDDLRLY